MAALAGERHVRAGKRDGVAKRWTIMVMGRVGKVRSFKVAPGVLFWSLVFLLVYLPVSVLVINQWVDLRRQVRSQAAEIERLELELARAERSRFKFEQHVALLEGYIASMESRGSGSETESQSEPEPAREPEASVQEGPAEIRPAEAPQAPPTPVQGLVDVEEMSSEQDGEAFAVTFNLVNITEGTDPVSGYVHILAGGREDGSTWWKVYPRGRVSKGLPESYRAGQPFIIQRFKPIQGRFDVRDGGGAPETIRIVVYDEAGRLIYHRDFEPGHAS